jgi:glucosamine-6-phosphate deaminase
MTINILNDNNSLGKAAAVAAAEILKFCIATKGQARIIAATGASQFTFLEALTATPGIEWAKVEMFHLDEYVGLPVTHPASFRKYLLERLIYRAGIKNYHLLDGERDVADVCAQTGWNISKAAIDVAFVGIGENGHLAFNDPPADFQTEKPYLVVELDDACRRQQVGEGWFKNMQEVPKQAISMSICQIMKAKKILCIVPDLRKAHAVKNCLEGSVTPDAPASILQKHPDVTVFLDTASASLLNNRPPVTHAD